MKPIQDHIDPIEDEFLRRLTPNDLSKLTPQQRRLYDGEGFDRTLPEIKVKKFKRRQKKAARNSRKKNR